jgi:amidase
VSEELVSKSAGDLAQLIKSRAVSVIEIIESHLDRIDQINPALNAIVTINPQIMDLARAAENELAAGRVMGPLHGVPLTVKDTIATAGIRSTSGSRLRAEYVPDSDAQVVERLRRAGAIILGKTNTSEMAIPYETDNPVFGRTNNPHDLNRTCGGSSGGEAAAIAARLSPVGVGSDLSGSIRVPAHFCGVAGLKPTTGRVPMDGHVPACVGSLSLGAVIGPMARRVFDLLLLFHVMAAESAIEVTETEFAERAQRELNGVKLAYYAGDGVAPVTDDIVTVVALAAKALTQAGLQTREERPPAVSEGSRLWIELFSRAAGEQLSKFYLGRDTEAGPSATAILRRSEKITSMETRIETAESLARAVVERERLREGLLRWMKSTPLILAPVGATAAFAHGVERLEVAGKSMSIFRAFSYSQAFNVFGLPAVSVPIARTAAGLPVGVQIIGRPFEEVRVLQAAAILERAFSN